MKIGLGEDAELVEMLLRGLHLIQPHPELEEANAHRMRGLELLGWSTKRWLGTDWLERFSSPRSY